ncbi:hypothetical protein ALC62_02103 [Cyphomyrmex costatus]|uniref:Gustatory receptor n=1 Tax=Cyphomyrmex costatus TaxID=456900 RepID=A0A151INA0_9HYME|nr:hypothetical protein ALC62_02103 [Cyphomyrmex costatus]
MAPLFIISSFHCLGLFEYPLGQPRLYLSCLYILAVWGSVIYCNCFPNIFYLWQHIPLGLLDIFILSRVLIVLLSIFISFYHYKELKTWIREISIVDDTLEALGAPEEYQMLSNWIIRIIIGWIAIIFTKLLTEIYDVFFLYQWKMSFNRAFRILFMNYFTNVLTLSALICGTVLGYTSSRFHRVNDRLQVLHSNLFENNYKCRRQNRFTVVRLRIVESKNRKQYIWTLM